MRHIRPDPRSNPLSVGLRVFHGQNSSMRNRQLDPLETAEIWRRSGKEVAIATVVSTWGSSPRPVGSRLVVDDQGNFEGSVSGGCVEGAVVTEALDVISSGEARLIEFGVANETAWRVGLSCGGIISVFVSRLS